MMTTAQKTPADSVADAEARLKACMDATAAAKAKLTPPLGDDPPGLNFDSSAASTRPPRRFGMPNWRNWKRGRFLARHRPRRGRGALRNCGHGIRHASTG